MRCLYYEIETFGLNAKIETSQYNFQLLENFFSPKRKNFCIIKQKGKLHSSPLEYLKWRSFDTLQINLLIILDPLKLRLIFESVILWKIYMHNNAQAVKSILFFVQGNIWSWTTHKEKWDKTSRKKNLYSKKEKWQTIIWHTPPTTHAFKMVHKTLSVFYFPVFFLCDGPSFLWERERKYCHNKGDGEAWRLAKQIWKNLIDTKCCSPFEHYTAFRYLYWRLS